MRNRVAEIIMLGCMITCWIFIWVGVTTKQSTFEYVLIFFALECIAVIIAHKNDADFEQFRREHV